MGSGEFEARNGMIFSANDTSLQGSGSISRQLSGDEALSGVG